MACRSLFTFAGFPEAPGDCHLLLPLQGFPSEVARRLEAARRLAPTPGAFLAVFLGCERITLPLAQPEAVDDAEFHYRIRLGGRKPGHLVIACLRRYPGSIGWQRRCGPMPLDRFIRRFLLPPIPAGKPSDEAAAASNQLG